MADDGVVYACNLTQNGVTTLWATANPTNGGGDATQLVTRSASIHITGRATDDRRVRDVYVFAALILVLLVKPGGILAIWSATPDDAFTRRLDKAGFKADQVTVRARSNGKGPRHTIWFATPR